MPALGHNPDDARRDAEPEFYQISHKDWGVFQGSHQGLGHWSKLSDTPGLGVAKFERDEAIRFADWILNHDVVNDPSDIRVEPYNMALHEKLLNEGLKHEQQTINIVWTRASLEHK